MSADTTYTRTLKRAMEAAGSDAKLAEALRTSLEVLRKWLSGELQPPSKVYFAALDIAQRSITKPILKRSRV